MPAPLFSVITVSFQNMDGLRRTCESLQTQTCTDYEWIVIDGGSSDGTKGFLENQTLTTNWLSERDAGIYDAMNKGIERADGDYLLFMNAGDLFAGAEVLDFVKEYIEQQSLPPGFIYGDARENVSNADIRDKPARPLSALRQGMITHHQAMLYRRGSARYDLSYHVAADYDFTLQYQPNNQNSLYIAKPLCIFEAGGLSQQQTALARREQRQIRAKQLKISAFENYLISFKQLMSLSLRRWAPALYWAFRSRLSGPSEP